MILMIYIFFFFFFNDTATTEIYTLSLHDALPISSGVGAGGGNQITAVRKLELEKTDRNGIQVEQRVRYRTGGTLNLYTAVRRCVVVSCTVAWRLRAEGRR